MRYRPLQQILALASCVAAWNAGAQAYDWKMSNYRVAAADIGASVYNLPWLVTSDDYYLGANKVMRGTGGSWEPVASPPGVARIDLDPQGNAWIVTKTKEIHRWNGTAFVKMPGTATDIGVAAGGSGAVWIIGADPVPGGYSISRWNGSGWDKVAGGGVRIDVDPQGNPWVVNASGEVYRYTGGGWVRLPGSGARDIAIGGDGSVVMVAGGTDREGGIVHQWDGTNWVKDERMKLTAVSVAVNGQAWGIGQGYVWSGWPTPGPSLAQVTRWAQTYAPIVAFHPQEAYFPTSAEAFQAIASPAGDGYALRDTSDTAKAGNLGAARVYVNAKVGYEYTDLQYWFLYAYNGAGTAYWKYLKGFTYDAIGDYSMAPCGQHEGDWEHITVRVHHKWNSLLSVYLSQHDGGAWFTPQQANMAGDRLKIYVSRNGHAAYWRPGRDYSHFISAGVIEFRLLNDTADGGRVWDTRSNGGPVLIGVQATPAIAFTPPAWTSVNGRWGRVYERGVAAARTDLEKRFGSVGGTLAGLGVVKLVDIIMDKAGLKEECSQEFGPVPPWKKGSWTGPDT